ncbi:MAG: hypothetical protein ACJAYG_001829 [Oceanicoccus sp.]|jgi:hypothetical protein
MQNKLFTLIAAGFCGLVIISVIVFIVFGGESKPIIKPSGESTPIIRKQEAVNPTQAIKQVTEQIRTPVIMQAPSNIVSPPAELQDSDSQVLLAVAGLAPELSTWLLPDEQIRKWVLAIDLVADGNLPKRYRPLDYPMDKFSTDSSGAGDVADQKNFARMDVLINTLAAIDSKTLADYYQSWLPILEKAYREQGKPGNFDQRLRQAISQVLAASPADQQQPLIRPSVLYKYEDDVLESASDVEKILWRTGANNTEKLQNLMREFRMELNSRS